MFVFADLYIQIGNYIFVIFQILECITKSEEYYLEYLYFLAVVYLAFVQLLMRFFEKGLFLLDRYMVIVLFYGSCRDRVRILYCYVRCIVVDGNRLFVIDRKFSLLQVVNIMIIVIELFKKLDVYMRVKDVIYYLVRFYYELGYTVERNKCVYEFKQFDFQFFIYSQGIVFRL